MQRRDFLKSAALSLPALSALSSCNSVTSRKNSEKAVNTSLIVKARTAMLSRQRAPWEQGVATQALMELGETESVALMADEAVLRRDKDGRLGMFGDGSTITDPASNGPGVLYAYKITGDEKFKEAADTMYRYLKETAPKTANGTLRHFTNRTQVWSDSMFMAPPFIAFYGDYDEAVRQVDGYLVYLWDKNKQMLWHQ